MGPHPDHGVVVCPSTFPSRVYFWECTFVGRPQNPFGPRCWKTNIMFFNTLEIPFLWMPQALVVIPTGLGGFGPTSYHYPLQSQHFLQWFHLLIRKWMTSWIITRPPCRLFEMIYSRWYWSTKWGHYGGPSPLLWCFHSHSHCTIEGRVWCGIVTPKPTPNHWLMNGNVPWDSALALRSYLPFWGPTTLCIGPNHGSSYHDVN